MSNAISHFSRFKCCCSPLHSATISFCNHLISLVASAAPAAAAPAAASAAAAADDDDLFGDEDEDEEAARELEKAKIAAAHAATKKHKVKEAAKSNILFDVKPFDAETDMAELEAAVRGIAMEGLTWGGSKLADVAYGVKKLVINTVVLDDLVSVDELQEQMESLELVQSTEIVAFNKI
jgi:translation elongation factor EF-1beta